MINLKQSAVNKAPDIIKSSVWFLSTKLLNPSRSFFFFQESFFYVSLPIICSSNFILFYNFSFSHFVSLSEIENRLNKSHSGGPHWCRGDVDIKMCIIGYM